MNVEEQTEYWFSGSRYDLETADAMLNTKRLLYVGFCCHLAVEKVLKGHFVKQQKAQHFTRTTCFYLHQNQALAKNARKPSLIFWIALLL